MLTQYAFFIAFSSIVACINYGLGLWFMLVAALLGDPVRKLAEGHPVFISVAFIPIFVIILLKIRAANKGKPSIFFYFPKFKKPFKWFLIIVTIQALRPIVANPAFLPFVLYGLVQYTGWIVAMMAGFYLIKREEDLIRLAKVYMVTITPFLLTVLPHLWGFQDQWPALKTMEIGATGWIYYPKSGGELTLLNGTFRFPEVMGWHAMTAAICALYILFRGNNKILWRMYSSSLFLFATFCALVSGRRKFLVGIALFIIIFLIISMRKNAKKMIGYIAVLAVLLGIGWHYARQGKVDSYVETGKAGFEDASSEYRQRAFGGIEWALKRDGFFGRGIGATAQGARHVTGSDEMVGRGGIEAGSGKLVSDLGVPGMFILAILTLTFIKSIYAMLSKRSALKINSTTVVFLLSMVLINIISFTLSHQIYADPLIGLLTGFGFGFLTAVPKMSEYAHHTLKEGR